MTLDSEENHPEMTSRLELAAVLKDFKETQVGMTVQMRSTCREREWERSRGNLEA